MPATYLIQLTKGGEAKAMKWALKRPKGSARITVPSGMEILIDRAVIEKWAREFARERLGELVSRCPSHLTEIKSDHNGDFCARCGARLSMSEMAEVRERLLGGAIGDFAPAGSKGSKAE